LELGAFENPTAPSAANPWPVKKNVEIQKTLENSGLSDHKADTWEAQRCTVWAGCSSLRHKALMELYVWGDAEIVPYLIAAATGHTNVSF
jgi:hypothetical protein